nr:hypothetical protein CFP56_37664 [Quercus suber]
MSSVSSEQLCVREGVGYNEVYLLGQNDLGTSSEERVPFANSPSMEDDDLDGDRSKSDSNKDIGNDEPPVQSVIGPDGIKEFIMLPLWTINDFNSSIKECHFNTFREKYQILTPAQLVYFEDTDKLFTDETNPDPQGDGDGANVNQEKSVEGAIHRLKGDQIVEEKVEDNPAVQS